MTSPAQETTVDLQVVRTEKRAEPFAPPRYTYDFADMPDASQIAALGGYCSLAAVRQSLAEGNDEWIVARRGKEIVAVVRVRTDEPWRSYKVDAPVVAEQHQRCGLERYLTHLAGLWVQSLALPISA